MRRTFRHLPGRALACTAMLFAPAMGLAQTTDIATIPLTYSLATQVKPNVMFILDDSGSMGYRFMPEAINDSNIDKSRCSNSSCSKATSGLEGNPPWYAYQVNTIYYNPNVTYFPAIDGAGNLMASYGSPWTSVKVNAFVGSATINLVSGYPEIVYCKYYDDAATDTRNCRRNGIDGGNPFNYNSVSTNGFPNGTASGDFRFPQTRYGNPFYYKVLPREHCSDVALNTCTLSSTAIGEYLYPAPLRFCQTSSDANKDDGGITGNASNGKPRCQESWSTSHKYARYGQFQRFDIVPATKTYAGRTGRTDCAAGSTCTYAEEMTNFANWYAYYSTRMQVMKTAVGYAFLELDGRYRVGFITINPGSTVSSSKYQKIDTFAGAARTSWYSKLYSINPSGGTPLREALSRVGRHFAGKKDGINKGMNDDPVQYSCQANVAILSTDGYWNGAAGDKLDGTAIGNHDNVNADYSTRVYGAYDGGLGSGGTLADVAMYYYAQDLRPEGSTGALGTDVSDNNVPKTTRDENKAQHMMTFTLGMGLGGFMRYVNNYEAAATKDFDFYKIRYGLPGCSWQTADSTCNWPPPPISDADDPSKLDDLWHAAVNGRGRFVSANDATTLYDGLVTALADLRVLVGAAAASATSSPNITTTDNAIYSSTYRTTKWDGELRADRIDAATGNVIEEAEWSAREKLNARTTASSDERTIYMAGSGTALAPFAWASMDTATQAYFGSKCSLLSQCAALSTEEKAIVNNGEKLVNFLRGQRGNELLFRERLYVLGDLVGSRPAFVRDPRRAYGDVPSYFDFKDLHANRRPVVYVGGNDGMLHAFDGNTGEELWAFVPRTVMPRLYKLAEAAYATQHEFFVDGSPTINDAYVNGAWRTILIGGMNAGGRGYYALDVTNPLSPTLLWEFCSSSLCAKNDPDLGLSFGNPIITKRAYDGKWVALVTSGYNNVSPGDGKGYLYVLDLGSGTLLRKVATGAGSTSDPSGLARMSNWVTDPDADNTAQYVYGGDLKGNLWRFDLGTATPTVLRMTTVKDGAGKYQPITTRPELGKIDGKRVIFVGTGRYLGPSDLQDPATLSPAGDWSYAGSLYAIKDTGVTMGNPRGTGTFKAQTIVNAGSGRRRVTGSTTDWGSDGGWYIDFPSTGERMNLDPQLVLGTLVATTNVPNNNACTAGGDSWIYQFNYKTGQATTSSTGGDVGLERDGTLTVGNAVIRLQSLALKIITTGANGVKETRGLNVGGGAANPRRIGWREVAM